MDESSKKLIGIAALVIIIAGGIIYIQSQSNGNGAFTTSSSDTANGNQNWNFMIGLCTSTSEIDPVPCDKEAVRSVTFTGRPIPMINLTQFGPNEATLSFIEPAQSRIENQQRGLPALNDIEIVNPVIYQKGSEPNSVIVLQTMPNNCVFKSVFRKNGNIITEQTLSYSGGCTEEQRAAGDYIIPKKQQNIVVLQ